MAGIVATAQADREHRPGPEREIPAYTYAWRLGLEPHCFVAVVPALVATLATLRRAERALARDATRYGPPATFGAYLARIATALAVPIMTGTAGSDGFYSSGQWAEWAPGDAVAVIDRWVAEWRREGATA
jgi:hypothetical protein